MKFFRALIKAVCLILVISLTLTAIFFRKNGVSIISLKSDGDIRAESVSVSIGSKSYKKIAESGYLEMYFDKTTSAVMIKETSGGKKWYAMPNGTDSSIFTLAAAAGDGNHVMNSQSNSVAFNTFSYEINKNGVKVEYITADNAETALRQKYLKNDIVFSVCVDFYLKDGNFFVDSEFSNLSGNPNCTVTLFSVLPFFGAFRNADENDFLLIPDGCGGTAFPYYESGEKTYSCKVYGADFAVKNEKTGSAVMGAFGMKRGENAYAVILSSSQEYAKINAVSSKDGFSRVYAEYSHDFASTDGKSLYAYNNESHKISLCYKFLSKGGATYADIAAACREQFIRNGTLSTSSIENYDEMPMFINLTGSYKTGRWKLKNDVYTTFPQAEDIIKRIKSKGVNNLLVRFSGAFENNSVNVLPSLGGKSGLENLSSFADSQNVRLYLDIDVLTYLSAFGRADFSAARGMDKIPFGTSVMNDFGQSRVVRFRTLSGAEKYIDSVIKKADDFSVSGYCFSDAGHVLSSDFSSSGAKRTEYKDGVASMLSAVSGAGDVMSDTGNIYTVKSSSSVVNIPVSVSYETGESYRQIPFVQTVLHGMAVLASPALNTEKNSKSAMLRCIEYGVCPSFTAVYDKPDDCKYNIKFDDISVSLISVYNEVSQALKSLEGERITGHSEVKDGVFCTNYGNSIRLYVNYNSSDVTVNGVTVPAGGYIRIG